ADEPALIKWAVESPPETFHVADPFHHSEDFAGSDSLRPDPSSQLRSRDGDRVSRGGLDRATARAQVWDRSQQDFRRVLLGTGVRNLGCSNRFHRPGASVLPATHSRTVFPAI